MTLSKREKQIAIVASVVIGGMLLFQVLLSPYFTRLDKATALIEDHKTKIVKADNLRKTDQAAKRRWQEMTGNALKSDASAAEGQLLDRVRDAAQSAGLSLQSIKPERSEKVSGFYRITLRVAATGNMFRTTRFINNIQASTIPLRISDMQITARKEGTDDLAIQFGIATLFDPPPVPDKVAKQPGATEVFQ